MPIANEYTDTLFIRWSSIFLSVRANLLCTLSLRGPCTSCFTSTDTNMYQDFWTYILLNLIFSCNFIPKLKCCRVSFKSQKCASLSCAQWDIWLTFKYLSTPLHHAQRKVTFIPKRNPCDYEKTRRRNLKIKQLFMYVLINILIIQTRGCLCLINK